MTGRRLSALGGEVKDEPGIYVRKKGIGRGGQERGPGMVPDRAGHADPGRDLDPDRICVSRLDGDGRRVRYRPGGPCGGGILGEYSPGSSGESAVWTSPDLAGPGMAGILGCARAGTGGAETYHRIRAADPALRPYDLLVCGQGDPAGAAGTAYLGDLCVGRKYAEGAAADRSQRDFSHQRRTGTVHTLSGRAAPLSRGAGNAPAGRFLFC